MVFFSLPEHLHWQLSSLLPKVTRYQSYRTGHSKALFICTWTPSSWNAHLVFFISALKKNHTQQVPPSPVRVVCSLKWFSNSTSLFQLATDRPSLPQSKNSTTSKHSSRQCTDTFKQMPQSGGPQDNFDLLVLCFQKLWPNISKPVDHTEKYVFCLIFYEHIIKAGLPPCAISIGHVLTNPPAPYSYSVSLCPRSCHTCPVYVTYLAPGSMWVCCPCFRHTSCICISFKVSYPELNTKLQMSFAQQDKEQKDHLPCPDTALW